MPVPALCKRCTACLQRHEGIQREVDDPEVVGFFFHHFTVPELQASAQTQCPICEPLYHQLEPILILNPPLPPSDEPLTFLLQNRINGPIPEGKVFLSAMLNSKVSEINGIKRVPYPLIFTLDDIQETTRHYTTAESSYSTQSPESWVTAVQWISNCLKEHPDCVAVSEPWYPTRFLDVGHDQDELVKVVDTATIFPRDGYVTLSHRWGDHPATKLNRTTEKSLREGVRADVFPLTIRNGIEIARRLHKRYIWIDSLCIYQDEDDQSDWLREVVVMNQVYSNSTLNISATGARSDGEGLFCARDPEKELRPCVISCSATGSLDDLQDYVLSDFSFASRNLTGAPLNQRGWVLQERLLSPRTLHFGATQLFYECRAGTVCERFPVSFPPSMAQITDLHFKSLEHLKHRTTPSDSPNADLIKYHTWSSVIRAYSATKLSFLQDRAIGISGIAKYMQSAHFEGADYVAGLWQPCLAGGLLWAVDDMAQVDFTPSTRSFPYRAPTWSWLSVEGEVIPGRTLRKGLCMEVIDVTVRNTPLHEQTGIIEDANLILKGRLRHLNIRALSFYVKDVDEHVAVPQQWMLNVGGVDLISPEESRQPGDRIAVVVSFDVPCEDFNAANEAKELFLMSGGGPWDISDYPFSRGDVDHFHDMLLLRCVDRDNAVFHRFGLARVQTDRHPEVFNTIKALDTDEAALPCMEYDPDSHMHTIMIK